jgi:hypothetical protein
MRWIVDEGIRCDLVFYAAPNLTGKRATLRVFPAGNKQGTDVAPENLRSMVIRAPIGTRFILCRSTGPNWEEVAWRCVELQEGNVVPPARVGGLPGVRLPDLDLLDAYDAKHTSRELQSTYPHADTLEDATGWTYGRVGELKGRVNAIRILKGGPRAPKRTPAEAALLALLQRVSLRGPDAVEALRDDVAAVLKELAPEADAQALITVALGD